MAKHRRMIQIDPAKLRQKLEERGVAMTDAGRQMGYSESYIKNVLKAGTIPVTAMTLLTVHYGITPESIKLEEPEPVIEQTEMEEYVAAVGPIDLHAEIVAAIREILAEDAETIATLIARGIHKALD